MLQRDGPSGDRGSTSSGTLLGDQKCGIGCCRSLLNGFFFVKSYFLFRLPYWYFFCNINLRVAINFFLRYHHTALRKSRRVLFRYHKQPWQAFQRKRKRMNEQAAFYLTFEPVVDGIMRNHCYLFPARIRLDWEERLG